MPGIVTKSPLFAVLQDSGALAENRETSSITGSSLGDPGRQTEHIFDSNLCELSRARELVRKTCALFPATVVTEDIVSQLEVAMTEVLSNVICHAYHGQPGQTIRLGIETTPTQIIFYLHHHGEPFTPATIPSPRFDGSREHGFGLYLISQCVTTVMYSSDEEKGSHITLIKQL